MTTHQAFHRQVTTILLSTAVWINLALPPAGAFAGEQVQSAGSMSVPRRGHTATVLADGRVLLLGGLDASGPLSAAEIFDPASKTFTLAGNLANPRYGHTATLLANGRVLIAGGQDASGPLVTAEIFDPADTTTPFRLLTAKMGAARVSHTATLRSDGTVLLAGGEANGTAEIFDPATETFYTPLLNMAAPRIGHTATPLADDNVFLVGGGNASIELYNAASNSFTLWPQGLSQIRSGHSSIPTIDGKLLVIGGDQTGSFELFDPVTGANPLGLSLGTPSTTANLLANSKILVLGPGVSGLFDETTSQLSPLVDTNAAALQLSGHTATELPTANKQILVAGGIDSSNNLLNSATLYNPAVIATDASDYPPFSWVNITGQGFLPNEIVTNQVEEIVGPAAGTNYAPWGVNADTNGAFTTTWQVFSDELLNTTLKLSAVGQTSGLRAETEFTDAGGSLTIGSNPVSAGNICAASASVPIHSFSLNGSGNPDSITAVSFTTSGSYTAGDVVNFKLYVTTANAFSTSTLLATISSAGPGTQTFTVSPSSANGNGMKFYWITVDVAASPVDGHTITVGATATANITAGAASKSGSGAASGTQTLRVTPATPTASNNGPLCASFTLNLTTPTVAGASYSWTGPNGFSSSTQNPSIPNATPAASGTYSVIVTVNGCSSAAGTTTATVNARPTAAVTGTATICNGSSTTIQAALTGSGPWNLTWSDGATQNGVASSPASRSVSPSTTTAYTVTSLNDTKCAAQVSDVTGSAVVTVNQKSAAPTSATASSTTICSGQSTTLTLNGGGGGTGETIHWYTGSCGGTAVGTGNNLSVSPTTTTTYFGRYEDGAPCNFNTTCASVTVTVNQKSADPTSATAGSSTICNGQSTTLTLNGGGGGTGETIHWYTGSCGGTAVGTGNGLSVTPTTTTTYFGRYEDGAPCNFNSACAQVTVAVNQKSADPTSATASPSTICNGQSTTLTLNGGGGGTGETIHWYTGSCGGTAVGTGNGLSVSPTTTTTYFGRYEDGTPCNFNSGCAAVIVTVNARPTVSLSGTQTICNGQSALLTLTVTGSGTISGTLSGGTPFSGAAPTITVSVSPTATTSYTVASLSDANCTATAADLGGSATVTVNQKSAAPTSATAGSSTICNGQSTTLTLNGGGGGTGETIHWYTGSCGGASVGTGNGLSVSPTTTTTYFGRYEDGAPCNFNTACSSATVTVNQKSADPTSATAGSSTICNGQSTTLTLNGGGGGTGETIHWYTGSCGGAAVGTGNGLSVSPTTTTTYFGRYEDGAPCSFNSGCAAVTVTVNSRPTALVSGTATICNGTSTSIQAALTGSGPWNLTWSDGFVQSAVVSSPATRSVTPSANTTYTVTALSDSKCTAQPGDLTGSAVVTLNPTPILGLTETDVSCNGGSDGTVTATFSGGTQFNGHKYNVSIDGGSAALNMSPFTFINLGMGLHTVLVQDANGCSATQSIMVNQPSPVVANAGLPQTICAGGSANIGDGPTASGGTPGYTYSWAPSTGLSSTTVANPTASPTSTTTYTVTVTDANGCTAVSTVKVTVNPLPTTSAITGSTSVCANQAGVTYSVTLTSGSSYAWTVPTGATITAGETGPNNNSITVTFGSTSGNVTVTETAATSCVGATKTLAVTVNPPSVGGTATATASPICSGSSTTISLTGQTGSIVKWQSSPDGSTWTDIASTANPLNTGTLTATTQFRAVVQSGPCSSANSSVAIVTVGDTTPPSITTCAPAQTISANANCQAPVPDFTSTVVASDNCSPSGSLIITQSPTAGTLAALGNTTITITVKDTSGNSATCTTSLTVKDTTPPAIIGCPANITVGTGPGRATCDQVVSWTPPTATDNCGTPTLTSDHNLGDTFPIGTTTVTYTAKDAAGNTSTCSFTVTVTDTTPPVITCPSDVTTTNAPGVCTSKGSLAVGTATATDNCTPSGSITITASRDDTHDNNLNAAFQVGVTHITWTAQDAAGNTATCVQTITINDVEKPVIHCPANITVNASPGLSTSNVTFNVTAADNCAVQSIVSVPASGSAFPIGTITVNSTATDIHGNISTCSFTVTGIDNQPPSITCPPTATVPCASAVPAHATDYASFGVAGGSASDNSGVNPSITFVSDVISGQTCPNRYTLTRTYQAKDATGNSATCTQTITVNDTTVPMITCPLDITQSTDLGLCTATVSVGTPSATDNCGSVNVAGVRSDALALNAPYPKGVTTITWTASDACSLTASCIQTITIKDTENPTISAIANKTVNTDPGVCTAVVSGIDPTPHDNCPGETVAYVLSGATIGSGSGSASGKTFAKGLTTVTYTVSDAATPPNTATTSFTVTVEDHENPTIATITDKTVNTDPGVCTAVVSGIDPTPHDNCPGETVAYVLSGATIGSGSGSASGKTFAKGLTTVTYTVSDAATPPNTATTSFTVTVEDHENPTIGTIANKTVNTDPAVCTAVVSGIDPAFGDNCPGETVAYVLSGATIGSGSGSASGKTFAKGLTTVTYTVSDAATPPNTATTSFTVTVEDHENPTIGTIANKTVNTDPGVCTAVVSGIDPTPHDNCPGETVAYVLSGATTGTGAGSASGKTFAKGVTTVTYTVSDAATPPNTASTTFTVTVEDHENPTIGAIANKTVNTDPGVCTAVVSGIDPTFGDNCPGETVAYVLSGATIGSGSGSASGKTFAKGLTTVTYTVSDAATPPNTATTSFTVTVEDHENPTIGTIANKTVNTDPGVCTAVVSGIDPTPHDNCPGETVAYVLSGATTGTGAGSASGKTFAKGVTTVTYTVSDAATPPNTASTTFTVTVEDHENPTIGTITDKTVNTDPGVCTAVVSGIDPAFGDNCPGETVAYVLSGATIGSGSGSASGKTFGKGVTTVTYTVSDAATPPNTATTSFTVTVEDHENPTIGTIANKTVNTDPGVCSAVVNGIDPTSHDNCPGSTVAYVLTGATTGSGADSASGKTFAKGVTTVTYTVSDAATPPNTATTSFTVTVEDHENPTIATITDKTVNTDPGVCTAVVSGIDPTPHDNCPGETVAYVLSGATIGSGSGSASGKTFAKGLTTVTYTVSDAATPPNTATTSFTVTVEDHENPTIGTIANKTVNTDPAVCTAVVSGIDPTSHDNCPGSTVAYVLTGATTGSGADSASGKTFAKGVTTVTYTVSDAATPPNTASTTFTVTVEDHENPTIGTITDKTVNTDPGVCTAVVSGIDPTPHDNCPGETVAYVLSGATIGSGSGSASGKTFAKGLTTVTYTVSDAATPPNTATTSFTVTVEDHENPTIGTIANKTVNTDPAVCTAVVSGIDPAFGDNCPGETVAYVLSGATIGSGSGSAIGKTFAKGLTTVTYTVSDAATPPNTASTTFTVTVEDHENPTIGTIADKTVNTDPNMCSAVVNGIDPTSHDNCPGSTVAYVLTGATTGSGADSASGKTFAKGVTTVTYTVIDAATPPNTASTTFTVTVEDHENPTIGTIANKTVNTDPGVCTAAVNGIDPTSHDNCPGSTVAYVLTGATTGSGAGSASGKTFAKGMTTVTYTVSDTATPPNTASTSFTVTVEDHENPTIGAIANKTVNTDPGLCSAVVGGIDPTFGDNCPGSTVAYVLSGATTGNEAGSASGKTFAKGMTTVTYTVSDTATPPNTASTSFTVTVEDHENPTIGAIANKTVNTDPSMCSAVVSGIDPTPHDNCPGETVAYVLSGATIGSGSGSASGKTFAKGLTTVTYTVSDTATPPNTASTSFTVTVQDHENPTISAIANKTVNTDPSMCSAVVSGVDPTFGDNCPGSTVAYVLSGATTGSGAGSASGKTFAKGMTTVTYTVSDTATPPNTASTSFTVTVQDHENPTISCPASKVVSTDPGKCSALVTGIAPAAKNDNCGIQSVTYVLTGATLGSGNNDASGTVFNKGVTTVTYTITDTSGNTATCSFTVTVNDTEKPVITFCPGNTNVATGCSGLTAVTIPTAVATDNCPGVIVTSARSDGKLLTDPYPLGVTTITWTAADTSGNTATCQTIVTVTFLAPNCNPMSSAVNKARIHFHHDGTSYADFQGSLTLLNGMIPDDLRDAPVAQNNTSIGHGKVKVIVANKVWYCNDSLVFNVSGVDPNNDTEKWDYHPTGPEEVMIMWKNNVQYQANNDAQVVKSVFGTLISRFIHQDKTELRWNNQGVALPASLTYNGAVVVNLSATGVATAGPGAVAIDQHGTVVDFDMMLQLVPGDQVMWSTGIGTGTPHTYTQTIGSGTATQVYYNAGGSFDIRVPRMDSTIVSSCTPLLATVQLQVGDSITACTTFNIVPSDPLKYETDEHWKFHDDDDE